jgi:Tol biopolymer transport system component
LGLYVTRHTIDGWTALTPAIPGFDAWHAGANISPDGSRLYFESNRRIPAVPGRVDTDLWTAERVGNAWGNPRPLGAPFDTPHNEHNVTVSSRGTICINSSRAGITSGHDILCAERSGSGWLPPIPLGTAVNSAQREIAPFLDPKERFLLFSSNREGGSGEYDLYISLRQGGQWQPAVNLGPAINSAVTDSNPAVSRDGERLLFTRSSEGRVTLYEVRFDPVWLNFK